MEKIKLNQKVYRELSHSRTYGWLKEQGQYLGLSWPCYEGQLVKEVPIYLTVDQYDDLMKIKDDFIKSGKPLYWGSNK